MNKLISSFFLLLAPISAFGALSATINWEFNTSGTASSVNAGCFNPSSAGFLTDYTATSATTSAPVIASASYNFVAGDVGAWIYSSAGTNWNTGTFCKIASVAANAATLDAAAGHCVKAVTGGFRLMPTQTVGIASTGSPTGGTIGIDYSMLTGAALVLTDASSVGASAAMTSVAAGFTKSMAGNCYHQTTTGTGAFGVVGWYEILTVDSTTQVTLDRTPNSGTASVNCTGRVGGALSFNSTLDDDVFEAMVGGNKAYFGGTGTYSLGETVSVASTSATVASPIEVEGYNTYRGDNPVGANRPTISAAGAVSIVFGQAQNIKNIIFSTVSAAGVNMGTNAQAENCKFYNSSTTSGRFGSTAGQTTAYQFCEFVSLNGSGLSMTISKGVVYGSYFHDSVNGILATIGASSPAVVRSIFEANTTSAFTSSGSAASFRLFDNTFYGTEAKLGTAIIYSAAPSTETKNINNIIYGFVTGVSVTGGTEQKSNTGSHNNYFGNTTDVSTFSKDPSDTAINPSFAGAAQITGTTGQATTNVLTQSGGDFSSVTNGQDYLHIVSGTGGGGVNVQNFKVGSHTSTTITTDANNIMVSGTSNADIIYFITTGHNFSPGTGLRAQGFPGLFSGSESTSYTDTGAVQRQETSGTADRARVQRGM